MHTEQQARMHDETAIPEDETVDDSIIGRALKASLLVVGGVISLVGLGILMVYLTHEPDEVEVVADVTPEELPRVRALPGIAPPGIPFTDITATAGIDFIHVNGATGDKLLPETMGGGCAFLDFDSDGDQDILLVNSRHWPWDAAADESTSHSLTLYENDGHGNFSDVTRSVGLDISIYGQGCAVGDYDNDGDPDLFISGVAANETPDDIDAHETGPHRLFRNENGHEFVDITADADVAGPPGAWGTSCGWFDYDRDGDLDLWVCHYVEWSREFDLALNFSLTGSDRAYGRPQSFTGTFAQLFRNDGEDAFTDVSVEAGIQGDASGRPLMGKSLGLTFADIDGDNWLDVVVANDTVQNFLFHNQQDGTFQEVAKVAGIAFDANGLARGAMGLDVGCARNDDDCFAVAIGNYANEMTAFYVSLPGALLFSDEAIANGLGPNTRLQLTFGVFFFDVDLDGRLDLLAANGHLEEDIALVQESQTYEQPPQLFWNAGPDSSTEFVPLGPEQCGDELFEPLVGRGSAFADIDGDGDLDVLIATTGQRPRLLRNESELGHHWIRLRLTGNGTTTNLDAIGARVELVAGGESRTQFVMPTRSYLSQSESTITFGLGELTEYESIEVTWPDGTTQLVTDLEIDREHRIEQQ